MQFNPQLVAIGQIRFVVHDDINRFISADVWVISKCWLVYAVLIQIYIWCQLLRNTH